MGGVELYSVFGWDIWFYVIGGLRDYSEEFIEVRMELDIREFW